MEILRITLQDFKEAEPLCRRALRKREEMLGPDHRDTLTSVPAPRMKGDKKMQRQLKGPMQYIYRIFTVYIYI